MDKLQRLIAASLVLIVGSMLLATYGGAQSAYASFGAIEQVSTSLTVSLSLSPNAGPIGLTVQVSGSGYSGNDYSCTISGTVVASQSCSVSGGALTGTFTVANVALGTYTVTATGDQNGDSATASFTVNSTPSITFSPTSASPGTTVQVSGTGFASSDTSCSLSGTPVISPTCSIVGGSLSGGFTVANFASGFYTITATGSPGGDSASGSFKINPAAPSITLNPSTARPGASVQVSGSGFSPSDSACSLSGGAVTSGTCSVSDGTITASFVVANVASGTYTITVTGSQAADSASALFTITSPLSISLSPGSGPPGFTVQVTGSGFSTSDNSCTIASPAVTSSSCSISSGTLTGSFVVANVAVGYYTVSATGSTGDSASSTFGVAPYSAPAVPGFPLEAIIAGLLLGLGTVIVLRRRVVRS